MSGEDPMYEITVDNPNSPKGEPIQIPGLGTFENGSTYVVSKDEAASYRAYHATQTTVRGADDDSIFGADLEQGPTLLQAAKNMYGVEVSTVSSDDAKTSKNASKSNTSGDEDTARMTPTNQANTDNPKMDKGGANEQNVVKVSAEPQAKNTGGEK